MKLKNPKAPHLPTEADAHGLLHEAFDQEPAYSANEAPTQPRHFDLGRADGDMSVRAHETKHVDQASLSSASLVDYELLRKSMLRRYSGSISGDTLPPSGLASGPVALPPKPEVIFAQTLRAGSRAVAKQTLSPNISQRGKAATKVFSFKNRRSVQREVQGCV